jgi:putative methylase
MRLRDLEIELQTIERVTDLDITLEQYPTPANIAATILYDAQISHGDIFEKIVLDLGCGDGIFALGAALLGARQAVGIDIQSKALKVSHQNSVMLRTEATTDFVLGDVKELSLSRRVDTVVSNPPFGIKKRGADMVFLKKALSVAKTIYSLHLSGEKNRAFLTNEIECLGGTITQIERFEFPIKKLYEFHRKAMHKIEVDLYRISMKESEDYG